VAQTATYVTADSLGYLSLAGMYASLGEVRERFCDACFSGEYLIDFPKRPVAGATPLRLVGA
jgi:amidophosphoribosyltransferase